MKNKKAKKKISRAELAWRITVIVLGALFLYCAVTYFITPLFMMQPQKNADAAAKVETIDTVAKIGIEGTYSLSGYLLDRPDTDELLIFFYGIADDAASEMLMLIECENVDCDIAIVDWPGYGESSGRPTDSALKEAAVDITSAFIKTMPDPDPGIYCSTSSISDAYLSADFDYHCSDLSIMGFSLGTGPSVYAASKTGCAALTLLAPYYDAADLYNGVTPVFYGPMKRLLGYSMDTYKYAAQVTAPVTIAASKADKRISYECSLKLSKCFPNGCEFITLEDTEHGDIPEMILSSHIFH